MSYGLTGQLEKVITTISNGSNTVTARSQVEYRYDNSGVRFIAIDKTDTNLSTTTVEGNSTGRTEYLIDHHNFTGFQQTISETVFNQNGQAVKRISYTIGLDEITQTTSKLDPVSGAVVGIPQTLTFGHDGHGSTKVLLGAAAALMQIYTYSAYGELLAIHNETGSRVSGNASELADATLALTRMLYNGENLDTRTGLYNFRARWYEAQTARFASVDPFSGNATDPLSFNKYGFAHGDPVQGADPTGMFFGLGGMMATIGNMNLGQALSVTRAYVGRQAAWAGIETALEIVIGQLIAAATGVPFEFKQDEVERSFLTNFASNLLTSGLGKMHKIRTLLDFGIRMISDVVFGGQELWWAATINLVSLGVSALLAHYGSKLLGECISKWGGCFIANTHVRIANMPTVSNIPGTQPINEISIGQRVTVAPPNGLEYDQTLGSINQDEWVLVHLTEVNSSNGKMEMEILRPRWWLNIVGAEIGRVVEFVIHEPKKTLRLLVESVEQCPSIVPGDGGIVTGKFTIRSASNLIQLNLANGEEFTGTSTHQAWNELTESWCKLESFNAGDRIRTHDGSAEIIEVLRDQPVQDVFNIEVLGWNIYHICLSGVLVHNNNINGCIPEPKPLVRMGGPMTVEELAEQSAKAAAHAEYGVHGVSVLLRNRQWTETTEKSPSNRRLRNLML